jgi:hypothetical protein
MDKEELLALLRAKPANKTAGAQPARTEAINRLAAALSVPSSFEDLEWELPPIARYLGPGIWMDAIKAESR